MKTKKDSGVLLSTFNPRKERHAESPIPTGDEFIGFGHVPASQQQGQIPTVIHTAIAPTTTITTTMTTKTTKQGLGSTSDVACPAQVNRTSIPDSGVVATLSRRPKTSNTAPLSAVKRAAPSAFAEERRSGLPTIQKKKKKKAISAPQSPDDPTTRGSTAEERPPKWYEDTPRSKSRNKNESNITKCKKACEAQDQKAQLRTFTDIRTKLHTIAFSPVNAELLKFSRMLHNSDGLPQLFDSTYTDGVKWPFDIQADAKELNNKWCREIFETDLFRGIAFKVQSKKVGGKTADSLDKTYDGLVSAKYHGNGDLLNGQCWPTQLCALRDGAHGSSQGSISGKTGDGTYSCIMSGGLDAKGQKYPDEDHGEWVLYTGTDGTNGEIAASTRRMLESVGNRPVRLIRSYKLESAYAPVLGFRYDGLYDVVAVERLDSVDSDRQRHRFRLVRKAGQDPIRGGEGPEKRPNDQEIEELHKHQRTVGRSKG